MAIDFSVAAEACEKVVAHTASTTAALAGMPSQPRFLEERGFTKQDLAMLHPAGSPARRLLWRVLDLIHVGAQLSVVFHGTLKKDALAEISQKQLGMTAVVSAAGKHTAIITFGHLRRVLQKGIDLLHGQAKETMTPNPKTIEKDALAAKALDMMERFAITSLLIVDPVGRPEGAIHLHHLLKAEVV